MNSQNPTQNSIKTPSTKPSITGGVLSILALLSASIAYFLTHSESRSTTEVTTAVGKVKDGPVADIASDSVTGILSMPFSVVAIMLGVLALLFTALRLGKVKAAGWVWSIIWILISVWAISIAVGAISLLKADPA